jgi:hypothetical protein
MTTATTQGCADLLIFLDEGSTFSPVENFTMFRGLRDLIGNSQSEKSTVVATKKLREAKKLERKTPLSVSEFSVVKYADKSSPVVGSGTTAPTPNE